MHTVKDDPDLTEYIIELKANVLNCYSTLASSSKEANM